MRGGERGGMLPSRGALNKQAVWFEVGHDEAMTESGICDDFGRPLQELYFSPSTGFEGGVETVSRQVHVQGGVENIQNNGCFPQRVSKGSIPKRHQKSHS